MVGRELLTVRLRGGEDHPGDEKVGVVDDEKSGNDNRENGKNMGVLRSWNLILTRIKALVWIACIKVMNYILRAVTLGRVESARGVLGLMVIPMIPSLMAIWRARKICSWF